MASVCSNCQFSTRQSSADYYRDALNTIDKIDKFHSYSIPSSIIDIIVDYAYVKEVNVSWITKLNIHCNCAGCRYDRLAVYPYSFSEDSSSDNEIDINCKRRHEKTMTVCSKCFVEGIYRSPHRLPYLNRNIHDCFLSNSLVLTNPYKYIIPTNYRLYYYRSNLPLEFDGKLIISCQ